MHTWITYEIQDHLAKQSELLELISGEYVRSERWEIFESNVRHLFPGDRERAKLINPWSYIGSIICDWISSYLGEPIEEQNINYMDVVEWLLVSGCIRFFQNVDTKKLEAIKANKYYYDASEKKEYFINIYEKKDESAFFSKKEYFLLLETFCKWIFERKLFLINNLDNLSEWTPVSFDTFSFLEWQPESVKIENIERLVIEKQVERPLLEKVKTIIYSIEKKLSEIDKNFLDYTEQFKIFRNIEIPENSYRTLSNGTQVVDFDELWKILMVNDLHGNSGGVEIVRNTNDLLINAIDYLDKQIKSISAITWIPLYAFWIQQEWGNDSWTSKIKSAWLFYKKIEKYTQVITALFYEYWETFNIPADKQILEFSEIVTADISEIVEVQKNMIELGIQSKKRAIMKINSTDENEAIKILQEIEQEQDSFSNTTKW